MSKQQSNQVSSIEQILKVKEVAKFLIKAGYDKAKL